MSVRFFLVFGMLAFFVKCPVQAQEILTNQSILAMYQNHVSSGIMVDKIRASHTQFDLSTNGLRQLLTAKVSDSVIEAMMLGTTMTDILTNTDVISLKEVNMSRRLMTQKINGSRAQFDMTTNGLIQLKNGKVPDAIQKIMMAAPYAQSTDKPIARIAAPSPKNNAKSTAQLSAQHTDKADDKGVLCTPFIDKFTKKEVTLSKVILRGKKASNIILGRGTSTLAGVEDMEVTLLFRRDDRTTVLVMYAQKPGIHTLQVEPTKTLMFLMNDESIMEFKPIVGAEYGIGFDYSGYNLDSKLCVYYEMSAEQLGILTKKLIKNYRLNTYNRHNYEDTVNESRAEQVQVAARCMLDEVTNLTK